MIHFAGKAVKVLALAVLSTVLLTGFTLAAESDIAIAVGATTGSSLRMRSEASTSASVVTTLNKGVAVAVLKGFVQATPTITMDGAKATIASTGATAIYYTTDGSDPRYSVEAKAYTAAVTLNNGDQLRAYAVANGKYSSAVAAKDYST